MPRVGLDSEPRLWAVAALGAASVAVAGVVAAPAFEAFGRPLAAELVRALYVPLCHQRPERSLALWGAPLAVCARCAGVYLGGWLGLGLVALRGKPWLRRGALVLAAAAVPNLLDIAAGIALGAGLPNGPRALVGLPLGLVLGGLLGDALLELAMRHSVRKLGSSAPHPRAGHGGREVNRASGEA